MKHFNIFYGKNNKGHKDLCQKTPDGETLRGTWRHGSNLSRPLFSESKMAAVASESEQVVDQANENILAEEKPAGEKLIEEEPKEGGMLSY